MNAITHIRTELFHLTQAEFARVVGVNQSTVSRWEKGARPSFSQIRAIQKAAAKKNLKCPIELFDSHMRAA